MKKIVYFDLVGTLVRGTRAIGEQYADQARIFGVVADPARLEAGFREAVASAPPMAFPGRSLGESAALERQWWVAVVRKVVERAEVSNALRGQIFDRFFASLYDHFTTADAWELYPDVLPAMHRLKAEGAVFGLITNYDSRVFPVLDALGLAPLLATVAIPARAGAAKPASAIFEYALEQLGGAPEDALHVGDEIDDDYRGAEAAGMQAWLIDRAGRFKGQEGLRRIDSLAELTLSDPR